MISEYLKNSVAGSVFEKTDKSLMYLGKSVFDEEIWLTPDQVKTHIFLSGSTGSGKTEMLTGLMANALGWGSGALFIDGKGDINFFAKLHLVAKALGREEDLLLINFMKGNVGADEGFASHTINPFGFLSADELIQLMTTMLPKASGDGVMWQERAISLISALINALVWLRDNSNEPLTANVIRESLNFKNLCRLHERLMMDAPYAVRAELRFYLNSLPGYQEEKGHKQSQVVLDQHGYLSMQWTRIFTLLSSNYGHILDELVPDVDIRDVILNRRVLVVLLPSLERSTSDIQNIGSLMVGMIKSMLGQALRTPIEGGWREVVEDRITNAKHPYMIVFDEVGQYLSDGMGMMAQQARSLNIGLIFATQDYDSLHYCNQREAEAIISNTNTKIFMKAENPSAPQITRVLQTYSGKKMQLQMRRDSLHRVRKQVPQDRLLHERQMSLVARANETEAHLKNVANWAREIDKMNIEYLKETEEDDAPELSTLLRGFKAGQMLVTHGPDCVQGKANYISIAELETPHEIGLERFVSLDNYSEVALEAREMERRVNSVALKLEALHEGARDTAATPSHPLKEIGTDNPNGVWNRMLSDYVFEAVDKQLAAARMQATVSKAGSEIKETETTPKAGSRYELIASIKGVES